MEANLSFKSLTLFVIISLATLAFFSINSNKISSELKIQIKEFKTDKEVYGSYEEMKIFLKIESSKNLENATIIVWGIKPRNYAYVNVSKIVDLKKGENEIILSAKTPYCTSGCGGVYPGPYDLNAEVWVNGKALANSNLKINLVSG